MDKLVRYHLLSVIWLTGVTVGVGLALEFWL
jgi:hypothetical protein